MKTVKTVTSISDVCDGDEYRFQDDPKNVVRVKQRQQNGYPNLLEEGVNVSDLNNKKVHKNLESFIAGSEREIYFGKSQRSNYQNRIALGKWKDKRLKWKKGPIGSLPDELLEDLFKFNSTVPLEASLKLLIKRKKNKESLLKIDVWTPVGVVIESDRMYGNYPN